MIQYKEGCLIKALQSKEVEIIGHQCNCMHKWERGIAPQIANAFPRALEVDLLTSKNDLGKLGKYSVAYDGDGGAIYNLYGQFGCKGTNDINYEALESALYKMGRDLWPKTKIGLPKIGAGLGGGDWRIIEELISRMLSKHEVTVYVRTV